MTETEPKVNQLRARPYWVVREVEGEDCIEAQTPTIEKAVECRNELHRLDPEYVLAIWHQTGGILHPPRTLKLRQLHGDT